MDNYITVNHITKKYRNGRGILDISLSIEKGDILGLVGANGSGKTTFLKTLSGLLRPDSGEIRIFGKDIQLNREQALYRVGAMIETPSFYPYLTAQENMNIVSKYYPALKITTDQIDKIFKLVGLFQYKNEKTKGFSLGMKQRLGLALTMINNPILYILDEPTNGLDITGVCDILSIIDRLSKDNQSAFVLSSHVASGLERVCNKIAFISEGSIKGVLSIEHIMKNYGSIEKAYEQFNLSCIAQREEQLN